MIYLDNAATSYPKPPLVRRAAAKAPSLYGNPGRGGHRLSLAAAEMVYDCRVAITELFHLEKPECVVFTAGATMALNLAIFTRVRRGMHILISDREHNAVLRPIHRLAREGIATYDIYPTGGDVEGGIRERIRPNTGMLIACHVSNVTSFCLPIERIGTLCRERGIYFIVDAAQSAGHLPLDLARIPYDAFCAPAHKGLLGIPGAGFAILRQAEALTPFLLGGSGVDSRLPDMPAELPERYEAGTLPTAGIAALLGGVRTLQRIGVEAVAEKEAKLQEEVLAGLSVIKGIRLYEPECRGSLIAFTHALHTPDAIARALDREGICTRAGYHCAPLAHRTIGTPPSGCVRLSFGYGNSPGDAKRFLGTLQKLLREGCL